MVYQMVNLFKLDQRVLFHFLIAEGWEFVEIYKWMFAKTLMVDWLHMFSMSRQHIMDILDQHNVVWCVVIGDSPALQYTLSVSKSFEYNERDKL
jgi:hypothetical protein